MGKLTTLIILILVFFSLATGQVPPVLEKQNEGAKAGKPEIETPEGVGKLNKRDVETFLDGLVPVLLEQSDVAGATVSIVKDGELLFVKGYGYADRENKTPVTADKTLFRPGSISKLFTWTAVMQLVERGKLDLNADVNNYLDFKLPETFNKPVTLKDILTHTPGFEEQIKDLFKYDADPPDLGDYLKTHIPRRIFPPGRVPAYSNYGTALAGYIVERVSGQPFDQYIEQNIFKPLEMNSSTFAQPLPENLAPDMSKGYELASEDALPFEVVGPFPAGSLSSTATDMAKFMLAHLGEGKPGEAQILKPETLKQMHSRLFFLDERANAMAHGFYEESSHNKRIIGHGGDTVAFHSDLHLIEDVHLGFFISYNSAGNGKASLREVIWEAFLDRYFPADLPGEPTLESAKADAAAVSGSYISSRRPEGSLFKTIALLGEANVSANEDGTISVEGLSDDNGKPKRWREVAPMQFRDVNGFDSLFFKPDENGRMQIVLPYPFMTFQRVGLWENGKLMLPVVGISLFLMLLTLVLWPVSWFVRRHYGQKLELTNWEWRLRLAVRIVFILDLIFVAGLVGLVVQMFSHLDFISDRGNMWIRIFQVIGVFGTVGTVIVFANAVHAWISKRYRIWGKLQATLFALACLGFLWLVLAGHFLIFTSRF